VSDEIPPNLGSVGKGVGISMGLTIAALVVIGLLSIAGARAQFGGVFVLIFGIGIVQAAWIIPLWVHYDKVGESETAKGILITAALIFLLNAGCWGLVWGIR
jgi:hypothetical protein